MPEGYCCACAAVLVRHDCARDQGGHSHIVRFGPNSHISSRPHFVLLSRFTFEDFDAFLMLTYPFVETGLGFSPKTGLGLHVQMLQTDWFECICHGFKSSAISVQTKDVSKNVCLMFS